MEILNSVLYGFSIVLMPINILYCFLGVLFGTLIGVLPGVGPVAAISLLLPVTYKVPATSPLILAMVLEPIFERALGQSLKISDGSFLIFLTRPIPLGFLIAAVLFYLIPYLIHYKKRIRESGFRDGM